MDTRHHHHLRTACNRHDGGEQVERLLRRVVDALQLVQAPLVQHLGRLGRLDEQSLRVRGGRGLYWDVSTDHQKDVLHPVGARSDGFLHGEEELPSVGGRERQVVTHADESDVERDDALGVLAPLEMRCEIREIGGERSTTAALVASDGYELQRGRIVENDLDEMMNEERRLQFFEESRIIDGRCASFRKR